MRCGVIADVHANLPALEAVLAFLAERGVDALLCAGDLVGYGPQPDECVERLRQAGAACVAGNHDLIAIGRMAPDRCVSLARDSLAWTRARLGKETRDYLDSLPLTREWSRAVLMAHGSLADPREYVTLPEQADRELGRLPPGCRVLVLGHTHRAWLHGAALPPGRPGVPTPLPASAACLLNPGAVGQSRERLARARCAVLDLARGEAVLHAVPYDLEACRRELRRRGLPERSCHPRPSPASALLGAALRLARRAAPARRRG